MTTNKHAWNLTDLASIPSNGLNVVTTFSCGGGSSMGYKRAGYSVLCANDIDPVMARHYQNNLHPAHYVLAPIKDLVPQLPSAAFGCDILDGSPPCSTFSMAGERDKDWSKHKQFREGQSAQVLDDLFFDFLDVAEQVRPRVILAENVKGLMTGQAKGYLTLIFARLREIGYRPSMFLLNARRCGVPQARERVFICAQRDDAPARNLVITANTPDVSCGEATADLRATDADLLATAPTGMDHTWWPLTAPGTSYVKASKKAGRASYGFGHYKASALKPCCTLSSQHQLVKHWSTNRCLTLLERARISSFPDDYVYEGYKIGGYIQGMSVPPKMMEVVASAVRDQWLT